MKKTYIIAGNYNEFRTWCLYHKVSTGSPLVEYIPEGQGEKILRGLRNPEVEVIGTYRDRKDFSELENVVRIVCRPEVTIQTVYEKETPKFTFNPFQSFRKVALDVQGAL
jgi:hypothetical protein